MSTTVTVRTDESLREALEQRARSQGKTLSELIREILENAVLERPLADRVGRLEGALRLDHSPGESADTWRATIRERNWRPRERRSR